MKKKPSRLDGLARSDLRAYFEAGRKPASQFGVGIEYERFGVMGRSSTQDPSASGPPVPEAPDTPPGAPPSRRNAPLPQPGIPSPEPGGPLARPGAPLPIDGPVSVTAVLNGLVARYGWQPRPLDGRLIELSRGECRITLEPGGQMELSGAVHPTITALAGELGSYLREVDSVSGPLGARWLAVGTHPSASLEEIPWLPKRRYELMREYLPERGKHAHQMMKGTCGAQVNLDFTDETDAMDKFRTAMSLSSVVAAMFAHSPITAGRPNGDLSQRCAVWLDTDPDRCGLLPFALEPSATFDDYIAWALSVPMLFLVRDDRWSPVRGVTFGAFLERGLDGERATLADWELHLSTLFPDVRLKAYIEIRGTDSSPPDLILAHAALWKGILYGGPDTLRAARDLLADLRWRDHLRLRQDIARLGLMAEAGGRLARDVARELVEVGALGLRAAGAADDARFLDPLKELTLERGISPAEDLLALFRSPPGDNLGAILDRVARLDPLA